MKTRRAMRAWVVLCVSLVAMPGVAWAISGPDADPADARAGVVAASVPGSYLVTFAPDVPLPAAGTTLAGGQVTSHLAFADAVRVDGVTAPDRVARAALRSVPDAIAVDPNHIYHLALLPDDTHWATGIDAEVASHRIAAPAAWDRSTGGPAARLCIVDTGLRTDHEEFAGRVVATKSFINGIPFRATLSPPDSHPSDIGHGTPVAGAASAAIHNGAGTAGVGNVDLIIAQAANGNRVEADHATRAINFCVEEGATVINLSFVQQAAANGALHRAIKDAQAAGAIVVAAAGNSQTTCPDCINYPAAFDGVVGVGATTAADHIAPFSNHGPMVDLVAPGVDRYLPGKAGPSAYGTTSGTSFSTPTVAGAVALLQAAMPTAGADAVVAALQSTAVDLGTVGRDDAYGHGRIDVAAALHVLLGETPRPQQPLLDSNFTTLPVDWAFTGDWRRDAACHSPAVGSAYLGFHAAGSCSGSAGGSGMATWTLDLTNRDTARLDISAYWKMPANDDAAVRLTAAVDGGPTHTLARWDAATTDAATWTTLTTRLDAFAGGPVTLSLVADTAGQSGLIWLADSVTVTAAEPDLPPVTTDDEVQFDEDSFVIIDPRLNDRDPEGTRLRVVALTQPDHGTASHNATLVTYHPAADFAGDDALTYTVADEAGRRATGILTLVVRPLPDAPVAAIEVDAATHTTAEAFTFTSESSDPDGDPLTLSWQLGDGTTAGNQTTVAHQYGRPGEYLVNLTASDPTGLAATAQMTITVTNAPPQPAWTHAPLAPLEGDDVTFTDHSTDSDGSIVARQWHVAGADAGQDETAHWTAGSSGDIVVCLQATDNAGDDAQSCDTLRIGNRPPQAVNDTATTDEDAAITVNVVGNDADAGGDPLTVAAASGPPGSTVTTDGGSITMLPAANFNGPMVVNYTVADDDGGRDNGTVTVTVRPVNDPPTAGLFAARPTVKVGESLRLTSTSTDIDGDPLTLRWNFGDGAAQGNHPTVDHTWGDNGTYTVRVTATDPDGATDSATLEVLVANHVPIANWTTSGPATEGETVLFLDTSSDADGSIAAWHWTFPDGATSDTERTTRTFPDQGSALVCLRVADDDGQTSDDTCRLLHIANAPPVALVDEVSVPEEQNLTLLPLANDYDVAADTIHLAGVEQPTNGRVDLLANDALRYTPDDNFSGMETITYTVADEDGGEATGTILVTVTNTPDAPRVSFGTRLDATPDGPLLNLLPNVVDADGDQLTMTWDLGDGTGPRAANDQQFEYRYSRPGTYNVVLRVSDGLHTVTANQTVHLANSPPTIDVARPTRGGLPAGQEVNVTQFFGVVARDIDGPIASTQWRFGDGGRSTEAHPTHRWLRAGEYEVSLTIRDSLGVEKTTTMTVAVIRDDFALQSTGVDDTEIEVGQAIDWSARVTGGTIPTNLTWSVAGDTRYGNYLVATWATPGVYEVKVTARDGLGESRQASHTVHVVARGETGGVASVPAAGAVNVTDVASTATGRFHAGGSGATINVALLVTGRADDLDADRVGGGHRVIRYAHFTEQAGHDASGVDGVTVSMVYHADDWRRVGGSAGRATLLYWNGTDWHDLLAVEPGNTIPGDGHFALKVFGTGHDAANNRVWARVEHTSTFALASRPPPPNDPPTIGIDRFCEHLVCTLRAIVVDPDGDATTVSWDFGDLGDATGVSLVQTFPAGGTYTVTATADDRHGHRVSATIDLAVTAAPAIPDAADDADAGTDANTDSNAGSGDAAGDVDDGADATINDSTSDGDNGAPGASLASAAAGLLAAVAVAARRGRRRDDN